LATSKHIPDQRVDVIVRELGGIRSNAGRVTPLIERDRAIAGRGERRDLRAPAVT
jgi:hypothetical protein